MGEAQQFDVRTCRECGCTDDNACEGGCFWVEDDLCSKCDEKMWAIWCYRSGEAFLTKRADVDEGGLEILVHEDEAKLRKAFEVISVHGYERGKYLVPSLPLAETEDEALNAAKDYRERLKRCVEKG